MTVDVLTEIEIRRSRDEVAAYASEPDNATAWYQNIKAVRWETPRPLDIGSRITFTATFLGRGLTYTYEIRENVPAERLVMSTDDGPFPMETTYEWRDGPGAVTVMSLRNRGEPPRFTGIGASLMARAIGKANRKDLKRLKELLERSS